jgi:hypothetical protein
MYGPVGPENHGWQCMGPLGLRSHRWQGMGLFGIAVALLAAKARRADIMTAVAQRATVGLPAMPERPEGSTQ